ncbi:MAG TPA: glycosyltransferase family 2 protein [Pseudomonadales bacterium]|nr:glycosyltransferase family 2 protein [Pseudomonadales bacterium]
MQSDRSSNYPLSIVIPVYNEELVLPALFAALDKIRADLVKAYGRVELVLVNDGSKDKSWQLMADYCRRRPDSIGVNLSRNFGHQLCLVAGLETARGEAVVSMDADLQDPPEVITQMMEAYRQGYDVVYATRRERGNETFTKRFTAHFFYFLIEKLSGVPIPRNTGDFRLLSRRALTELSRLRETHHFLRGLVPWIGFPQTQIFYDRADRAAGETHYPFRKMMRFAFDGIASMSAVPLRLAYVFSLLLFGVFVGYIVYVLYEHIFRGSVLVPGWTSIMSAITIFGTIQLLLFGVFGEYLGRIYEQSKNRPLFIVQEIVQADSVTESTSQKS